MFQKLIDFFKNLFSVFSSAKEKTTINEPATTTYGDIDLPEANENEAQDGSEIIEDIPVLVINETDPIISEPIDDPVIEEPVIEPEIVEDPVIEDPVSTDDPNAPTVDDLIITSTPTEVGNNQPKHIQKFLWCLDNGHGKKSAGKRSPKLENGKRLLEYKFNRDIVKRITKRLDNIGVAYYNVVPEIDVDNFLKDRVYRANVKSSSLPKIFVSIHANAGPAPTGKWTKPHVNGIETWYYHNNRRGRKIAAIFQAKLISKLHWTNRHLKSRPTNQFYVLKNTSMTSILTENGFYNNKEQCLQLLKSEVRQKIADAHVEAILEIERKGV